MELEPITSRGAVAGSVHQYLISTVLALLGVIAVKYFLEWLRRYLLLKNIPGPADSFPPRFLIENLVPRVFSTPNKDITSEIAKVIRHVVENHADTEDGVCKVYIGFTPLVLLSSPTSVETILTDKVNVRKGITYRFLDSYLPDSLLTSTGELYKFQRKLLTPAFHFKILEDYMELMNKHSSAFVTYLGKKPKGEEIRLFQELSRCTINIISETAVGHDVDAMNGENFYAKALTLLQFLVLVRTIRPWMWFDAFYYRFTHEGALVKHCINSMRGLSTRIMEKLIKEREDEAASMEKAKLNGEPLPPPPPEKKKLRTFIQILLDSYRQNPEVVSKKMVRSGVDSMLFAGQDTTASSLSWLMFLLGNHPEIQEKCRQEVFKIIGPDPAAPVTSEHLKGMRYFEATFKEGMRVYAPVPLIGRTLNTDIKIKGKNRTFTIPAGVQVFTSLFHLHRNPKCFPDPLKFDPERFLDDNAPHKAYAFAFVPFSGGPRNCVGQKFAMNEAKVMVAHLLRNYRWTSTRSVDEVKLRFEVVLRAKGDLRIKLEPLRPTEIVEREK